MQRIITRSKRETIKLGKKIARRLKGGEVLVLIGNLGVGKTVLAQGLAQGLGVKHHINSPTFVLMKVYKIKNQKIKIKNLIHVDAYRLNSGQNLLDIGLQDWLGKENSVILIEWADRVKDIWPKKIIKIKLQIKSSHQRLITLK